MMDPIRFGDARSNARSLVIGRRVIADTTFVWISSPGTEIAPCQVPDVCRAIYTAAGLAPPDLPEVLDEAEVEALARTVYYAETGTSGADARTRDIARVLMAHGYRKPRKQAEP